MYVLEMLLTVADVHFTSSNHDYTNGFFLSQVIETYFKNCKILLSIVDSTEKPSISY
jgi:hypothetical protein